jgi:hypothetical protein
VPLVEHVKNVREPNVMDPNVSKASYISYIF